MRAEAPTSANECIELNPTPQSVSLDGIFINQSALARATFMDQGYLSRVLSGKHVPGLFAAQKIADALGWSLDRFAAALAARIKELRYPGLPGATQSPIILPKRLQNLLDKGRSSK